MAVVSEGEGENLMGLGVSLSPGCDEKRWVEVLILWAWEGTGEGEGGSSSSSRRLPQPISTLEPVRSNLLMMPTPCLCVAC